VTAAAQDTPPPYRTIVFDCDSTLSAIEGIEELFPEPSPELVRLTAAAMNGEVPLEAVYGRRLELARPSREAVLAVGARYVGSMLPHAHELVAALHSLDKRVAIVSGGLLPAVAVLARELGIPERDVHAVDLSFDEAGEYAGFEEGSPLARAGGKLELLRRLSDAGPTVLVGDGATDLEAAPACARFVAFGGVVRREAVFAGAWIATEERDLAALLPLALSPDEIASLRSRPEHSRLVDAAAAWL
jgi:phosphoserine phosphatase